MAAKKKTKRGKTAKPSKSGPKRTKATKKPSTASNPTPSKSTQADSDAGKAAFPVVGIGASAGGLNAFKKFFSAMPSDSGMSFVLIPHLDPTHESLMVELLAKQTDMPVCEAEHGMAMQANHVYIIPPNKYLASRDGRLQLTMPPDRRGLQTAIDFFFRSLADNLQERAIGIILSGTGSHGALGLKEIKLAGGMVMVQQPDSAEYDQMPRSAIATGLVDSVLPPEEMPEALVRYGQHSYVNGHQEPAPTEVADHEQLRNVLAVLRTHTKYDFSCYRKNMLTRRVQRRMGLCNIDQLADYLGFLRESRNEVAALYKDLLIGVTGFFREAEAFQVLRQRVMPVLVKRADADIPVRVWVPGCATGEEAYSIAIVLLEQFATAGKSPNIQVFATDIDEDSLERGRQGIYPESVAADLSPEHLRRFFVKADEQNYQVNKQLRESVVFAPQSLISDAPFSKLDLVSCRNLLIYLEPEVQQKAISLFHFALRKGGYLLLGSSETIGRRVDLFKPISKKWRVYRRIGPVRPALVDVPIVATGTRRLQAPHGERTPRPQMSVAQLTRKLLLDQYSPASVLINRKFEVLYFHGPTDKYVAQPAGEPTQDLMAMARHGLRTKIRSVVMRALREDKTETVADARVKNNGKYYPCHVTVQPIQEPKEAMGLLLVTFTDRPEAATTSTTEAEDAEESSLVRQLEYELKTTREDLQGTVEEMESANEELKAANEEVMSMNEELQSANEELETSKEELQSLNEELTTVNNQLHEKMDDLEQTTNDITNLFASTDIATIFLDAKMRIKRFTPATAKLLNLLATDVGRPLSNISSKFTNEELLSDATRVLDKLMPLEKEVLTDDGRCYLRRILPYRTEDNRIEGLVITFVEITERKKAADKVNEARLYAEGIIQTVRGPLVVLDANQRVKSGNASFYQTFHVTPQETENQLFYELGNRQWDIPQLRELLDEILPKKARVVDFEVRHEFEQIGKRTMALNALTLQSTGGRPDQVLLAIEDVTERKQAEVNRLLKVFQDSADPILIMDLEGHVIDMNDEAVRTYGWSREELEGKPIKMLVPEEWHEQADEWLARCLRGEEVRNVESRRISKSGNVVPVLITLSRLTDGDQQPMAIATIGKDITKLKQTEAELKSMQKDLLRIADEEDSRIGQELHDNTGQQLMGLGLLAENLAESLADKSLPDAQKATRIANELGRSLKDVRLLSQRLISVELDAQGLMSALKELASRTNELPKIKCLFECKRPVEVLDNFCATNIYRIAQEAISNVLKHSNAQQIKITLATDRGAVHLAILDDGVGISKQPEGGMGLRLMNYRAGIIGAQFAIGPADGGGTLVTCSLAQAIGR